MEKSWSSEILNEYTIYRTSREERSIFWEVTTSVILSKKLYIYMCPTPNGFRDRAITLYSSRIGDQREILRTVLNAGIYCSSDKVGTIYSVQYIFDNSTVNINALCSSCEDIACCSSVQCTYILPCLEWPILWPTRILAFPFGTYCIWMIKLSIYNGYYLRIKYITKSYFSVFLSIKFRIKYFCEFGLIFVCLKCSWSMVKLDLNLRYREYTWMALFVSLKV
jgi:hypothetical protein